MYLFWYFTHTHTHTHTYESLLLIIGDFIMFVMLNSVDWLQSYIAFYFFLQYLIQCRRWVFKCRMGLMAELPFHLMRVWIKNLWVIFLSPAIVKKDTNNIHHNWYIRFFKHVDGDLILMYEKKFVVWDKIHFSDFYALRINLMTFKCVLLNEQKKKAKYLKECNRSWE